MNAQDVIRKPLDTEKGRALTEKRNTYLFQVAREANKLEIRHAIERLFGVKVNTVRTVIAHGKAVRRGAKVGRKGHVKKAYVTLKEGESISLFEGV